MPLSSVPLLHPLLWGLNVEWVKNFRTSPFGVHNAYDFSLKDIVYCLKFHALSTGKAAKSDPSKSKTSTDDPQCLSTERLLGATCGFMTSTQEAAGNAAGAGPHAPCL